MFMPSFGGPVALCEACFPLFGRGSFADLPLVWPAGGAP
jgi:hypothetical protein